MSDVARLSFCNDADFSTWAGHRDAISVLKGNFGFDVIDSFWLFSPNGSELALFRADMSQPGPYHDEILEEVRSGELGILHSSGDFDSTPTATRPERSLVERALRYLEKQARVPTVWTNHGGVHDVQNHGGAQPIYQQGDLPSSDVYCLDLLLQHGVRFFWLDHHTTNHFVQDPDDGHQHSALVREPTRAGFQIQCFRRFRGALPCAPDAQTLDRQLTPENLEALARTRGVTIVYQHWGCHRDASGTPLPAPTPVFPPSSLRALDRLAEFRDCGLIDVVALPDLLESLVA